MAKKLPTERLTEVLLEALDLVTAHQTLRMMVGEVLNVSSPLSTEEKMVALRGALDSTVQPLPVAITEAAAYLRIHGGRLTSSRLAQQKKRGGTSSSNFNPAHHLPDSIVPQITMPDGFSLDDIETRLKGLKIDE